MPGQYCISDDLVFQDISNFSLIGIDQCVITCTSPASVLIINVTNFIFQNIELMSCIKCHKEYFNVTYFDLLYAIDAIPFIKVTEYHTSLFLYNSSSVTISDINAIATIMTSFTAILIVNIQDVSKVINVKVLINSFNCTKYNYPVRVSGIFVYPSDGKSKDGVEFIKLIIKNYHYNNSYELCTNHFHCAITQLFLESDKKYQKFAICIQNSAFSGLKNCTILCYYGEANRVYGTKYCDNTVARIRSVIIKNSTISNNTGHNQLNMFYIAFKSLLHYKGWWQWFTTKLLMHNIIAFKDCIFSNNSDINTIIYVKPSTTAILVGQIIISNSTFQKTKMYILS